MPPKEVPFRDRYQSVTEKSGVRPRSPDRIRSPRPMVRTCQCRNRLTSSSQAQAASSTPPRLGPPLHQDRSSGLSGWGPRCPLGWIPDLSATRIEERLEPERDPGTAARDHSGTLPFLNHRAPETSLHTCSAGGHCAYELSPVQQEHWSSSFPCAEVEECSRRVYVV